MAPLPLACGLSIACPVLEVPGCITPVPLEFGSGAFMLPVAPCAKAPDANAVSAQVDTTVAILFMVISLVLSNAGTNASFQKLFLTDLDVSSLETSSISTAARKSDRPPPEDLGGGLGAGSIDSSDMLGISPSARRSAPAVP